MGIQGATSLYSLRSISKDEERNGGKGRIGPSKKVQRGTSLDNEFSEYDEPEERKRGLHHKNRKSDLVEDLHHKNRKSDLAEDSDGLWGDDEDDDDCKA